MANTRIFTEWIGERMGIGGYLSNQDRGTPLQVANPSWKQCPSTYRRSLSLMTIRERYPLPQGEEKGRKRERKILRGILRGIL
jgi:hypothetical protein